MNNSIPANDNQTTSTLAVKAKIEIIAQ